MSVSRRPRLSHTGCAVTCAQSTQRQDVIHPFSDAAYAHRLRDTLRLWPAFDRARAAAEGSVTKALTLFAIAAEYPRACRSWTTAEQSGLILRVRARPQGRKRRNRVHDPGQPVMAADEVHRSAGALLPTSTPWHDLALRPNGFPKPQRFSETFRSIYPRFPGFSRPLGSF